MKSHDWCVAVFKCTPAEVRNMLVIIYGFIKDLKGVKDLHFVVRDRVENEVVFSFRVFVESGSEKAIKSKIAYKLRSFMHASVEISPQTPLF